MLSPVRLSISDQLPSYLVNGDASFMDYYDLPDEWLTAVDEAVAALGIECWGDFSDYPELGLCDITGEEGPVLAVTGFIRKDGTSAVSGATLEDVRRIKDGLLAAYPESATLTTSPAGIDSLSVPGLTFTFYPEDINGSRYDVRTRRDLD